MRLLAQLPVLGVVFVCVIWAVICLVVTQIWVAIKLQSEMARLSGSGGVAAVVVGVDGLVVIVPPVLFCLAWFVARRRNWPPTAGAGGARTTSTAG